MNTLINKRKVRLFALEAAKTRAHRFTRVGDDFYPKCEANLRKFIRDYIHQMPSRGRTIL